MGIWKKRRKENWKDGGRGKGESGKWKQKSMFESLSSPAAAKDNRTNGIDVQQPANSSSPSSSYHTSTRQSQTMNQENPSYSTHTTGSNASFPNVVTNRREPSSSDHHHQQKQQDAWTLRIKSFQDVQIQIASHSLVSQLKEEARLALGDRAKDVYMRLICKGRLLSPDDSPIQDFNVHNGDVVHAVLAKPKEVQQETSMHSDTSSNNTIGSRRRRQPNSRAPPSNSNNSNGSSTISTSRRNRNRGIIIGPGGRVTRAPDGEDTNPGESSSSEEEEEEEIDEEIGAAAGTQGQPQQRRRRPRRRNRLGFDSLRNNGLSRPEITAIRTYFSRQVDRYIQEHPNSHDDEPDLRTRRLLMGTLLQ